MAPTRTVLTAGSAALSVGVAAALALSATLGMSASRSPSPLAAGGTRTAHLNSSEPTPTPASSVPTPAPTPNRGQRAEPGSALPSKGAGEQRKSPPAQRVPEQAPRRTPAPKPTATRKPTPSKTQSRPAPGPAAQQARTTTSPVPQRGPTEWPALNAAIARIPGYVSSGIRWRVSSRYGHLGATDLATGDIYISPSVSPSLLDSVVRHEYSHIVTVRAYNGQWRTAKSALNVAFGGTGRTGVERAADCMALALGASWTHYTGCSRSDWQRHAQRLLSGRPL